MWIAEGCEKQWYYQGPSQRGAQYLYSDEAIHLALTIRQLLGLAFRQTEGFLQSVTRLMKVDVSVPNYTILCRRMKTLSVHITPRKKVTDIAFDGTGLKVYGEGEWKVRQHGPSKRRTWRKIYIGVDPDTKQVQLMEVTSNATHDSDAAKALLERYPMPDLQRFYGDGGFDKWKVYDVLEKLSVEPIIPPQKNAKIKRHGNSSGRPLDRDRTIRFIRKKGRTQWKIQSGYHKRNLSENFFFRYKTIFGDELKSKTFENQKMEVKLNTQILNKMIERGCPKSCKA